MKDIRDRYTAEEFNEDNMVQSERSMRSSAFLEDDTIEQTVFDYIYGDKSVDLDVFLWDDDPQNTITTMHARHWQYIIIISISIISIIVIVVNSVTRWSATRTGPQAADDE